jgi:hypothetical protein
MLRPLPQLACSIDARRRITPLYKPRKEVKFLQITPNIARQYHLYSHD